MFNFMKNQGDNSKGSEKSISTKKHLTEVSLRLFQDKGFEKTTMREIAREAEVSLGSAYYYFKNKEEIVLFFYQSSLEKTLEYSEKIFAQPKPLDQKLLEFFDSKFKELLPNRNFLKVLSRSAFDSAAPTSPFSEQNQPIKQKVIGLLEKAIEEENVKAGKDLRPILGSLIWHLQMALLLYWLHDKSDNQIRTQKLTEKTLKLFFTFVGLSSLPLIRGFNKSFVEIFQLIEASHETT